MDMTSGWTGRAACALQAALRLSNEAFAEHLGIGVRTVAGWHQKPTLRPKPEMQQLLDTALEQASPGARDRFAKLADHAEQQPEPTRADHRLSDDPNIGSALEWLDAHAGWQAGEARRRVAARLGQLDACSLRDKGALRGTVDQRRVAHALGEYYREGADGHGRYRARIDDRATATTSVLTCPGWLDLACPLLPASDQLAVTAAPPDAGLALDEYAAERAVHRLAETLTLDVRLTDTPLYRLLDTNVRQGSIGGSVGLVPFVEYALTMDLLEGELVDALATDAPVPRGALPLRDRYLPDVDSVLNIAGRLCAGGALALCAIARPASPHRGPADYVLLVQERSGSVINAARRLAVIPKGFHEPLRDLRADAHLGATLRREMEEELFGRDDVDSTVADQRRADPMHPSLLSEPMRWLTSAPDRLRMECAGFGLNLVSGNYEFASLIVIEDEEFWSCYGGLIEANWESSTLRQYSSLDSDLLTELINDGAWSNEGLFALLQGLRRLGEIGGHRVNLPVIEWEIAHSEH